MTVMSEILDRLSREKIHMTLIDPASQSLSKTAEIARAADEAGTDFIMVGGSTGITKKLMDECIDSIKSVTDRRVIIFPGSDSMVSEKADALYFMSLLNSRSIEFVVRHQARAAPYVKRFGIEPIPVGYIIVEPGMTVGKTGLADLIKRDDPQSAVSYALVAQFFGMNMVYLEAGSGAPEHVPDRMITAVKRELRIPLIVGGGIRSEGAAREVVAAGADIVVTGTVAERSGDVSKALKPIIKAVKGDI